MTLELLVVGTGPAGVSAALWAHSLGLTVRMLERAREPGGQLHAIHFHPPQLPGLVSLDGPALALACASQLESRKIDVRYGAAASALALGEGDPEVVEVDGARFAARALLLATGLRRRRLGVPGESEFAGRGVSTSSTRDRGLLAGGDVWVVGGGDAAYENALRLAEVGCRVRLAVRGAVRARAEFRSRVAAEPRIEVLERARVTAIAGDDRVRSVRLELPSGTREMPAGGVVIKIGWRPNTEWCREAVSCDAEGYVRVDARGRTSQAGVWAAGDVTRPALASLATAYGAAALAVADIREHLRSE